MRYENLSEKKRASVLSKSKAWSTTPGCVAIIICQHVLLWTSLYVAASTLYILGIEAVLKNDIASVVMLLVASIVSLVALTIQNLATHWRTKARDRWQSERVDTCQRLAKFIFQLLSFIWMVTVVLVMVWTASPQVGCSTESTTGQLSPFDVGSTCIVNRAGIIASMVAWAACGTLFLLLNKVNEPSRCWLFGFVKEESLMPLFLPYRKSHEQPMFSDMSFKCRSSSSLSSQTAVNPWGMSTTHSLVPEPRKPLGLGIYTGHRSAPSLLHPRPSLSSIRSHASLSLPPPPPPTEPLPPLPAYIPRKYYRPSSVQKAISPPKKAYGLHPHSSLPSVRVVVPPPTLSKNNLATLNRSNESQNSLSSIYSRSISGESQTIPRPRMLSDAGRSISSSSTSTITPKRSNLGAMRLAENPENVIMERSRASSESSESDIDDVATLQARLPMSRNGSQVTLVKISEQEGYVNRESGLSSRFSCKPLNVRKTRDCDNVF